MNLCVKRLTAQPPKPKRTDAKTKNFATLWKRLKRFEKLCLLGTGGSSEVYQARDLELGRYVAIKILWVGQKPKLCPEAERFHSEGKILAKMQNPHLPAVYDYGKAAGFHYLIMEFIRGGTLADRMAHGSMPWMNVVPIICELCEALQALHEVSIVHRDLKPQNILFDHYGRLKLCDLGLARSYALDLNDEAKPAALLLAGTPGYMAPEQFHPGGDIDCRTDIFAVGILLHHMLTGKLPSPQGGPPSNMAKIPRFFDAIVAKATALNPADRYATALALKDALQHEQAFRKAMIISVGLGGILFFVTVMIAANLLR